VNFSREDLQLLKKACQARGEDVGVFIRVATLREMARLGWLDEQRKRFLEID
jgi:hypothetical protein